MQNVGHVISGSGKITIMLGSKVYTVETDHVSYQEILSAIRTKDYSELETFLEIGKQVNKFGEGKVRVIDGIIYYDSMPVHNALTTRIIALMNAKMPFQPMVSFFDNLMLNPSKNTCDQIYTFLEFNSLPIGEDGTFFAYKRVTDDFKDFFTGTFDNSVGAVVKMPRNMCDDDMHKTCSTGLHVCSKDYLQYYQGGAGRMIIVKVNPKDVVAVPVDYKNTKMRCCEYTVVAEISKDIEKEDSKEYFTAPLYTVKGEVAEPMKKSNLPVGTVDPYQLGREAFGRGVADYDNPYNDDSNDFDRWNEGYDDADNEAFRLEHGDGMDVSNDDSDISNHDSVVTTYHNVRDAKGRFVKR